MPEWLNLTKNNDNSQFNDLLNIVDLSSLNKYQKFTYDIVKKHKEGPQFFNEDELKNCLPIPPNKIYSKEVSANRKQFPIRLAYAITTHKTQGETLEKGVIHLGKMRKIWAQHLFNFLDSKKLQIL